MKPKICAMCRLDLKKGHFHRYRDVAYVGASNERREIIWALCNQCYEIGKKQNINIEGMHGGYRQSTQRMMGDKFHYIRELK